MVQAGLLTRPKPMTEEQKKKETLLMLRQVRNLVCRCAIHCIMYALQFLKDKLRADYHDDPRWVEALAPDEAPRVTD